MRRLRPREVAAVVLVVIGVVWTRINQPIEGPVLIVFSKDHGLTVADLLSLAAFGAALWLVLPRRPND